MKQMKKIDRRGFMGYVGVGLLSGWGGCGRWQGGVRSGALGESGEVVFGVIADVHQDLTPDATERLAEFIAAANRREVDFIIQLGDFCFPKEANGEFLLTWNQFMGQRYHVLGNHDHDTCDKKTTRQFWAGMNDNSSMPGDYYSFEAGDYHFVVLDCNYLKLGDEYVAYDNSNYFQHAEARTYVNPEQIEWLREDLARTNKPTIVFSHQGIARAVKNRAAIMEVFARANSEAGYPKVIACFCGHHHIDEHRVVDDIHYLQINSASYYWVGQGYGRMAPYEDSLYGVVTLRRPGVIEIEGKSSRFSSPTPQERGYPRADEITARISDRELRYNGRLLV